MSASIFHLTGKGKITRDSIRTLLDTANALGGVTVQRHGKELRRYVVGTGSGFALHISHLQNVDAMIAAVETLARIATLRDDGAYGIWIDREQRTIYFDTLSSYTYAADALTIADTRNEKAIYDIVDDRVMEVAEWDDLIHSK